MSIHMEGMHRARSGKRHRASVHSPGHTAISAPARVQLRSPPECTTGVSRRLPHIGGVGHALPFQHCSLLQGVGVRLKIPSLQSWLGLPAASPHPGTIQEFAQSCFIRTEHACHPGNYAKFQVCCVKNWDKRPNIGTEDAPCALITEEIIRVIGALCQELEAQTNTYIYIFYYLTSMEISGILILRTSG